ncbi:cell number regulator 8-like [Solanum verrucosum]|uniref:cell number regulator 8-like n=1 Tax=Solanum verrucosum TaxID=315347 RepID=UPI0020D1816E|nr:cell number regulator 8-like [Solanum verrucosum]
MANVEESSPFLPSQKSDSNNEMKPTKPSSSNSGKIPAPSAAAEPVKPASSAVSMGWTAEGLPMGHSVGTAVVGEPIMRRAQWESSLCSCFGKNDEFASSDFEVCLLGTLAPCVLYGSNAERIGSSPGSFTNHCLPYTGLFLIGQSFFGWNCMAPWFSYPNRTAIRQRFNLEGNCEAVTSSCGCHGGFVEDEERREHCESTCDFLTHIFCHPCALCQEGRELRRRLPHPGFNAKPVRFMMPPGDQTMGR